MAIYSKVSHKKNVIFHSYVSHCQRVNPLRSHWIPFSHHKNTINHHKITINHHKITINHHKITINHRNITINHHKITINHRDITINCWESGSFLLLLCRAFWHRRPWQGLRVGAEHHAVRLLAGSATSTVLGHSRWSYVMRISWEYHDNIMLYKLFYHDNTILYHVISW